MEKIEIDDTLLGFKELALRHFQPLTRSDCEQNTHNADLETGYLWWSTQ